MRTFALSGLAALAISMMAPATVWAWTTEQVSPNSSTGTALSEGDDPLKALQDKVDGKNPVGQSGFYVSGGAGRQSSPFGFNSNQTDTTVPFGYLPQPGFRGPPQ